MQTLLYILFLIGIFLLLNAFFIYPVSITVLAFFKKSRKTDSNFQPAISILIAVRNEEKVIRQRIENIAKLDYDENKIKLFVCSDSSTDKTNSILEELNKKYTWLNISFSQKRLGKAGILNSLIEDVDTDIVIFSDANTIFQKDAVKNLVREFADNKIGVVCGHLILTDDEVYQSESVEELKYWSFETQIKRAEGKLGILIGANGGIFAIRKSLYKKIPTQKAVTDDLYLSLFPMLEGYKVVFEDNAVAYESVGKNVSEEFSRKVRFSATNYQTLSFLKKLLFLRRPLISYAFFSHKVIRWFLPFILLFVLIDNIFIAGKNMFVDVTLILQIVFYLLALLGYILSKMKLRFSLFSMPYFFVVTNIAIFKGFLNFITKKHSVIWEPTER